MPKKIAAKDRIARPTKAELLAAHNKTVPDVIDYDLKVLFAGINPGLYTAAIGHHFGRPGNRFWPALYASGFTDRLLSPDQEDELLPLGLGITNVVARATATADELTAEDYRSGGEQLRQKVKDYRPRCLAILGIGAYRQAFQQPQAKLGRQATQLYQTILWVLPNPSGLNAHYQAADLAKVFAELRAAVLTINQQ